MYDVPASMTLEGFNNLLRAVARVTKALHVNPPTKPRPWQGASPCSTLPRPPDLSFAFSHALQLPCFPHEVEKSGCILHARCRHGYLSSPAPPPAASGSSTLSSNLPTSSLTKPEIPLHHVALDRRIPNHTLPPPQQSLRPLRPPRPAHRLPPLPHTTQHVHLLALRSRPYRTPCSTHSHPVTLSLPRPCLVLHPRQRRQRHLHRSLRYNLVPRSRTTQRRHHR